MRRTSLAVVGIVLAALAIVSCTQRDPATGGENANVAIQEKPIVDPQGTTAGASKQEPGATTSGATQDPAETLRLDKYEASLAQALNYLADRKHAQALDAFETARTFHDNEFIRGEIAKLKSRLEQDKAAAKTVQELETILAEGKAEDAGALANEALKEFGGADVSDQLVKLKQQADALQSAQEDAAARFARFRKEGEAALREKNLRAAALALEQAVAAREDRAVRQQLDEVRRSLDQYDALRKQASALRRDPQRLEEAVAALQEAAKHWDTLHVRQEIDECTLALQKRRDRVSAADFEVRGDVGLPAAGRAVAEEILPYLKSRFDLVERAQISKVVAELKLQADLDPDQQREVGRLANVRYLVLGSITPLGGLTVNARLVDVKSGLVVQTAKIVAATPEEMMQLLPELGKQLLMTDEEKAAYDTARAELIKVEAPAADAPLPPPPDVPAVGAPLPPPVIADVAIPPAMGGLRQDDFAKLPPPVEGRPLPVAVDGGEAELVFKRRLLHVVLNLGDNLFRRGHYRDAHRHFELAMNLAPGNFDLLIRLDRVRPHLPPPVVIVDPVIVARPRIAILNFPVYGDPRLVPPYLAGWTPYQLAPYFYPYYDVVDPGEVYWYMANMGMTLRDLMFDPWARRWLGRALGIRYFVFGNIVQTASFDVNTYMVDAEFGFLQGHGRVHVRNPYELKLRLGELAYLTRLDPAARGRYLVDQDRFNMLLIQAEDRFGRREFTLAIGIYENALRLRPNHAGVLTRLELARRRAHELALEEARQRELARLRALEAERLRRQWELAQAAEAARLRAAQRPTVVAVDVRLRAQNQLVSQAQLYVKTRNFALGIRTYESALALAPRDDLVRELALARAEAERATALQLADAVAKREADLRHQQEAALALARQKLEEDRAARLAAESIALKAQEKLDRTAYQAAFDEGQRLLAAGKYDAAIAALQSARRLRRTEAVEALLSQAMVESARAQAKDDQAKQELERRLAAERERRLKAEAEAKRNQELYAEALKLAQKALAERNFDLAQAKFTEAGKVFRTDDVLTGMRRAEDGRAQLLARAKAVKDKALADERKAARIKELLAEGQQALSGQQLDAAVKALRQAKNLAPDNVEVLAALTKAEMERDRRAAEMRRKLEGDEARKSFQRLLDSGKANLANKQFEAAKVALTEALKINPDSGDAKSALQSVEKALAQIDVSAKAKVEAQKRMEAYQKLVSDGRIAHSAGRFDDAINAFSAAQKLLPGDQASANLLKDAQRARQDAANAAALAAKKRAEELQRQADLKKSLDQGRSALAAKNVAAAEKALQAASAIAPKDADVARALEQLRQLKGQLAAEAAAKEKLTQQHRALIDSGKSMFAVKKFDEAVKAFADAVALMPDDKTGRDLLRQAQQALQEARSAQAAEQKRLDQFSTLMKQGQAALNAKRFAEAQSAFAAALKLMPNDTSARQGHQDATRLLEGSTKKGPPEDAKKKAAEDPKKKVVDDPKKKPAPPPPPPPDAQALYLKAMQNAATLEKQQKFADAVKAYEEALKHQPKDANATKGQKAAQFNLHLQEGQKHLQAKRFPEAVREFDAALVIAPNNPIATNLLNKAKQGKK